MRRLSSDSNTSRTDTGGYALAIGSAFASGLAVVIGKWNLAAMQPLAMNALIFSIASIVLTATVLPIKGVKRVFTQTPKGWFWIFMFSIGSWGAIWLYWAGIKQMDPSLAALINRTEVPVAIVLGMIFLRERFTRWETFGTLLAIAGIVVMKITLRFEYSTGFWLVLFGAVLFGITEFVSKIAVRHVEPSILAYIRNMIVALFYWIAVYAGGVSFGGLETVWPGVLVLGVVGPILARLPYLWALKKLELSKVAVISQSQPVYVILLSLLFLSQLPTFREITGGIFLTAGCVILVLSRQRSRPSSVGGC